MNNLNSVLLEGQLVRDPEMQDTEKPECRFRMSSTRTYKEDYEYQREVSHFDVVVSGRLAGICAESLRAGSGVRISPFIRMAPPSGVMLLTWMVIWPAASALTF